mmetsp:Transcript_13859/g.13641  ORF Transcript_13859/g.13641 Transcript_13859/m.13641 type:complete len:81 (+) Transcript_13859:189-431(+)
MVDSFFWRDPEEIERQERMAAEAAAYEASKNTMVEATGMAAATATTGVEGTAANAAYFEEGEEWTGATGGDWAAASADQW